MADVSAPPVDASIDVEVVFCASRSAIDSTRLKLPIGTSVDDALKAAGLPGRHPQLDLAGSRIGIWGRVVPLQQILQDGDRVEVYRPLQIEPKEARRLRQRHQAVKRALEKS